MVHVCPCRLNYPWQQEKPTTQQVMGGGGAPDEMAVDLQERGGEEES